MNTGFNAMQLISNILVVLFVAVSLLLLAAGLLRRAHFKQVRMAWGSGKLFGLPLAPTLFLAGILVLIAYALGTPERALTIGWVSLGAYVGGGLCWYLGSMLSGATIVTDSCIGVRVGRRQVILPWHEITDYAITSRGRTVKYVFFRIDRTGHKRRLEVSVPVGINERFQSIVEFRLDNRFNRSIQRPMGKRALEQ